MDVVTFEASAGGNKDADGNLLTVNWGTFEVKKDDGSWVSATMDSDTTTGSYNETRTIKKTMRSVGKPGGQGWMEFRLTATAGSLTDNTNYSVAVLFPNRERIKNGFMGQANAMWTATNNDITANQQGRERGCWVRINTSTGEFGGGLVFSPYCHPNSPATIQLGDRLPDNSGGPVNPNTGGVYYLASFHTHPPHEFGNFARPSGPSGWDADFDIANDVPGLVYDYSANPVPANHPRGSPGQINFTTNQIRRIRP